MAAFCVVATCSLVKVYRRFVGSPIALMMEAANTSETSTTFYHTTQNNSPGNSNFRHVINVKLVTGFKFAINTCYRFPLWNLKPQTTLEVEKKTLSFLELGTPRKQFAVASSGRGFN
jgi:hypothetical protein